MLKHVHQKLLIDLESLTASRRKGITRTFHGLVRRHTLQSRSNDGQTFSHNDCIPNSGDFCMVRPIDKLHRIFWLAIPFSRLQKNRQIRKLNSSIKRVTVLGFEPRFLEPQSRVLTTRRHRPCSKAYPPNSIIKHLLCSMLVTCSSWVLMSDTVVF